MKSNNLLIFEISGEYAHFRKFNTTSSPLTYTIPTLPALAGLLGAVMGIEREVSPNKYREGVIPVNEVFSAENSKIGIQILNPTKKVNIGFNLLNTGKGASSFFNIVNRTQVEFELLKDPHFRIFFWHKDQKLLNNISDRIKTMNYHFSPYLGLAQFTCLVEWAGLEPLNEIEKKGEISDIITAVDLSKLPKTHSINFKNGFYTTDTMPMKMQRDRIVTRYSEVFLEKNGLSISVSTDKCWQTSFGNILFL